MVNNIIFTAQHATYSLYTVTSQLRQIQLRNTSLMVTTLLNLIIEQAVKQRLITNIISPILFRAI